MLLRNVQMKLCHAKKQLATYGTMQKNISIRKILKILKFAIKYLFSKCAQICLSVDWLTSSEDILEGKLAGKNIFRGGLVNKNIRFYGFKNW